MKTEVDPKNIQAAKEYVDRQLETMRKFGSAPQNFSEDEYRSLVEEIADAINLK